MLLGRRALIPTAHKSTACVGDTNQSFTSQRQTRTSKHIEMEEKDKEKSFMQKMRENLKPKTEEKKKREDVLKNTDRNFAERGITYQEVSTNHYIDHLSYIIYSLPAYVREGYVNGHFMRKLLYGRKGQFKKMIFP